MGQRSMTMARAAAFAGALALLVGGCAGPSGAPPEKIWRNGAGVPVDPRYGTPLPGSQPEY